MDVMAIVIKTLLSIVLPVLIGLGFVEFESNKDPEVFIVIFLLFIVLIVTSFWGVS